MFSARFMCVLVERPGHSQALLNFTIIGNLRIGNLRIYLCQLPALLELTFANAPRRWSYGKQALGGYGIWESGTGTHNFQISKKFKNGLKCEGNAPNSYECAFIILQISFMSSVISDLYLKPVSDWKDNAKHFL